jgi:hypothetical protein
MAPADSADQPSVTEVAESSYGRGTPYPWNRK